ncbi:hypothetical protein IPJ72_01375 [Candidatus Peregrinibacteria bacterium]|nr:MAG: hypothetical protein IPJ72_01375 [Candidatus Peregrinibacteria bacterium]
MYVFLITITLALYSFVLVNASDLVRMHAIVGDLTTSSQAFYAAEGFLERSLSEIDDLNAPIQQKNFSHQRQNNIGSSLFVNHQGIPVRIHNSEYQLDAGILIDREDETLDYTSIEPAAFDRLLFREVPFEANFNEIQFDFGREPTALLFEIFQFPKEGDPLTFPDFDSFKNAADSSVDRAIINTNDPASFKTFQFNNTIVSAFSVSSLHGYSQALRVTGFDPVHYDYMISFQTLDNLPIDYRFQAYFQQRPVPLAGLFQSFKISAITSNGLFQSIHFQRRADNGLISGLQFAHFSNQSIHK